MSGLLPSLMETDLCWTFDPEPLAEEEDVIDAVDVPDETELLVPLALL